MLYRNCYLVGLINCYCRVMCSIACIFVWNPNILPIFDVRTWWEDPGTRPCPHVSSVSCGLCVDPRGDMYLCPVGQIVCTQGSQAGRRFWQLFLSGSLKKRQRFGYCTREKSGSLHTHTHRHTHTWSSCTAKSSWYFFPLLNSDSCMQ